MSEINTSEPHEAAHLFHIEVPGRGWIARAGECIVTARPDQARAFTPAEAEGVFRKLLAIGYEGISSVYCLPDVGAKAKSVDRKDDERRYSIQSASEDGGTYTWQRDCWAKREPRWLFTSAEAEQELARLCELRPHAKTMFIADEVEAKEMAAVRGPAMEKCLESNGYRDMDVNGRRTDDGKRLRYQGVAAGEAAVHEAGFLGNKSKGLAEWPEHLKGPAATSDGGAGQGGSDKDAGDLESRVKSSQAHASEYLEREYESYVKHVAEGNPMLMDDWLAGSDIPGIVRARTVASGGTCVGKIWWSADNLAEAQRWEAELTPKGASVELKPEDDRPIVDVIITLDCARANEILGYEVGHEEWLDQDDEPVDLARQRP